MITVRGRVRATVRLDQGRDGDGGPCVIATTWATDRPFPRTGGVGVTFEIETDAGEILRVDPFAGLVVVPVRRRERDGEGVSREAGWLAAGDEVTVEGERDGDLVRAARVAGEAHRGDASSEHRVPPRALTAGVEIREASQAPAPAPEPSRPRGKKHRRGNPEASPPMPSQPASDGDET